MGWGMWALAAGVVAVAITGNQLWGQTVGWKESGKVAAIQWLQGVTDGLGYWAIPVYIGIHALSIALCLPYAVFFESGASMLFGFLPALFCVFSAKLLGASASFWIGRVAFRSSGSAAQWVERNKYFKMLSRGVERDGWKFVLLARFSPIPSYIINYALAAMNIRFLSDFMLPTVIGCLPMILQNTSIGSLASAAVASASGTGKSQQLWSYAFPLIGIVSSVVISLRIKKYSSAIAVSDDSGHRFGAESPGESSNHQGANDKTR